LARYSILQTFYASGRWQTFRAGIIAERGLKCEKCGKVIANPKDVTLHHTPIELTPGNVHDVAIALNPDNVNLICSGCHNAEHSRFGQAREKAVYIVYGAPCSGKTTYVEQHMKRGDIIICMDRLFEAITGLPPYDKPDSLLPNVRAVYNLLIDNIKTRYGKWGNAYIIGGFADKYKRERLAEELDAELVYCECSKEEAIRRIDFDEHKRNMRAEYAGYIERWFEQYTE
jgi:hypothetical protein